MDHQQGSPLSGPGKRAPRWKIMTSSNDLAAGSKLQDTTFHGDASPSAWVKRCSTAMGARLAAIGAASQPGSRRQASMSSRKLPPRTHHSDELPTGPFSRRNLVDHFPPRSIGAEDRGQQEQQNWFHREGLVLRVLPGGRGANKS